MRALRANDFEGLPSDMQGFICIAEEKNENIYYMSTAHQSALVEYFAPQNDPIVFSNYVKNSAAYPSFANFIKKKTASWKGIMPTVATSYDSTEWSKQMGPLGAEEISLIVNTLDSADDLRIVPNPFSSNARMDRAKIIFSNRLDETHFDTILNNLAIFSTTTAPAKLRLRLKNVMAMVEKVKEESMQGISQPSPIDFNNILFDHYADPTAAKTTYESLLFENQRTANDLGFFEDDNYTPFNVRLFPEDIALIRMHLNDIDNELFVERTSSQATQKGSSPNLYSIDFFADFEKIDELLANVATTNTKLSHSGRSRIAELRREVGRLKAQRDKWTEKWIWYPSYSALSGAFVALAFTFAHKWFGGGGSGGGGNIIQNNYYSGKEADSKKGLM